MEKGLVRDIIALDDLFIGSGKDTPDGIEALY